MRSFLTRVAVCLTLLVLFAIPAEAQRPFPPTGGPGSRVTPVRPPTPRPADIQKFLRDRRDKQNEDEDEGEPTDAPDKKDVSPSRLRKLGSEIMAGLEKDLRKVRDLTAVYDVTLIGTAGLEGRLEVRHVMRRGAGTETDHRLEIVSVAPDGAKVPLEDLIVNEIGGRRAIAWQRLPGKDFAPVRESGLEHRIGGTRLRVEDLIPVDASRYKLTYEGGRDRGGSRTHLFKSKPATRGAALTELAFRQEDRLPVAWKAGSDDDEREAVDSVVRTRDGIKAFERRNVQYHGDGGSAVVVTKTRQVNRGVGKDSFDPTTPVKPLGPSDP